MAWRARPPLAGRADSSPKWDHSSACDGRRATNCRPTSSSSWRGKLLTDRAIPIVVVARPCLRYTTAVRSLCGFLTVRFSSSVNFLATIWPHIEILRSLVVYVNYHNKDYLRKTPCDWLCGDDAAFVKLLRPLVYLILSQPVILVLRKWRTSIEWRLSSCCHT